MVATFARQSSAAAAAVPRALQIAEAHIRAGVESFNELWSTLAAVESASDEATWPPVALMDNISRPAFSPASVGKSERSRSTTPSASKSVVRAMSFPWD